MAGFHLSVLSAFLLFRIGTVGWSRTNFCGFGVHGTSTYTTTVSQIGGRGRTRTAVAWFAATHLIHSDTRPRTCKIHCLALASVTAVGLLRIHR